MRNLLICWFIWGISKFKTLDCYTSKKLVQISLPSCQIVNVYYAVEFFGFSSHMFLRTPYQKIKIVSQKSFCCLPRSLCIICFTCLTLLRELFNLKTQSQLTRFIKKSIGSNNLEKYPHILFHFITIKMAILVCDNHNSYSPTFRLVLKRLNTHYI